MIVQFTNTVWLNIDVDDIDRIDIDTATFDDLTTPAAYFVRVTRNNGEENNSDYFKTFADARACVDAFISALKEED